MDWNGDGIRDLVFGERMGYVNFYAADRDGGLSFAGHAFTEEGLEIRTRYNSSPWLVDWNEDGRLDLLLTGYLTDTVHGGILRVYPGVGEWSGSPVFDADYIDLTWLYDQRRTTARTADLDCDGDKDLVLGYETGEVFYAENIGENSNPVFRSYSVLLCDDGPVNVYSRFSGSGRARVDVCDYNNDGTLDLIVGCQSGWIYFFEGYPPDPDGGGGQSAVVSLFILDPPGENGFDYDLLIPSDASASLTVTDRSGTFIASDSGLSNGAGSLDLPGAAPGIYFAEAACPYGRAARYLLVL